MGIKSAEAFQDLPDRPGNDELRKHGHAEESPENPRPAGQSKACEGVGGRGCDEQGNHGGGTRHDQAVSYGRQKVAVKERGFIKGQTAVRPPGRRNRFHVNLGFQRSHDEPEKWKQTAQDGNENSNE